MPSYEMTGIYPAWVDVDLGAVRRNALRLHQAAGVPLVAMVKADGYGTGAIRIARTLETLGPRIWGLGVATLNEACMLRDAGVTARILCCTPLLPQELADAYSLDVRPSLHRVRDVQEWTRVADGSPWHLHVDTGMSRAGVRWDDVASIADAHVAPPEGVFTHFHSAERDDGSREVQEARFDEAVRTLREFLPANVLEHRDNSAGIAARHRAGDRSPGALARPGIGLYGAFVADALALEPVASLRARIIDLRDVRCGETVSYGATFAAERDCRIATVAVGHGDGYRQLFSNRGEALLHGVRIPVAGIVSMDMTMFDVSAVPCSVGDVVTLLGQDGDDCLSADAVAARAGMSVYELLVGLALRAPRVYHDHEMSRSESPLPHVSARSPSRGVNAELGVSHEQS